MRMIGTIRLQGDSYQIQGFLKRGHTQTTYPFFQNFDPLLLNSCYVVLRFFEGPPPPLVATWFVYYPSFQSNGIHTTQKFKHSKKAKNFKSKLYCAGYVTVTCNAMMERYFCQLTQLSSGKLKNNEFLKYEYSIFHRGFGSSGFF